MRFTRSSAVHAVAAVMLIAVLAGVALAQSKDQPRPKKRPVVKGREVFFDTDTLPSEQAINPYIILASQNSWSKPILDHTGKPHHHGHLVQVIVDGGNGLQDPPNPDGSPGGDDSLAYGNFNMLRLTGIDSKLDLSGESGMFFSDKFFIPYQQPPRAYYLRLWEGDDVATAPYYQDTIEYKTDGGDRGGGMISLHGGIPCEVDWTFGASKPRPKDTGGSRK